MIVKKAPSEKWSKVRLSDVADEYSVRIDNPAKSGFLRFVGSNHIGRFELRVTSWGSTDEVTSAMKVFQPGDYLFVRRSLYASDFRERAARSDFSGICSGDILTIRERPDAVFPGYLAVVLNSPQIWSYVVAHATGSITRRIKWRQLQEFEFLLPPTCDQARLVKALSAAELLQRDLRNLQNAAEMVFNSLLKERIGHGFKPSDYQGWEGDSEPNARFVKLSDVASVNRGKFSHRPRNLPQFFGGRYPFAQTGDVASARGRDFFPSQSLSDEGIQYSKSFPAGTIFLTIAAVIAATAICTMETYCTDSVVGITPNDPSDVDYPEFALRFTRPYLDFEVATQTAQKNINLEVLRPLTIPWPSKEYRDAIAKELAMAESVIRNIEARQAAVVKLAHQMIRENFEVPA